MRARLVRTLPIVVVAAALVALLLPAGSAGGSAHSFVVGMASATFPDFPAPGESTSEQMLISAHDGQSGPRGIIVFRSPLAQVPLAIADVTCLRVDGRDAVVGGSFRKPFLYTVSRSQPPSLLLHFAVQLRDNGPPSHGMRDAVHPVVFDDRPRPPTFSPCNFDLPLFQVDRGDYVVRDAD